MKRIKCIFLCGVILILIGAKDVLVFSMVDRVMLKTLAFVVGVSLVWLAFFLEKKFLRKK